MTLHPNWVRNYGFSVGDDWQPEFLASLQEIRATVAGQVERTLECEFAAGRRPTLPDVLDAILTAVREVAVIGVPHAIDSSSVTPNDARVVGPRAVHNVFEPAARLDRDALTVER